MTAVLLANELTSLISEAKRRNADLRNAAEKSQQELKSLPTTSEQQLAADLSRRPAFVEPFLIACATRNPKFAGSGIVCLQRLVISKGLPKSRLQDALEAFNACTDLSLDVQLKILQALPSLLQNYAAELEGDLLSGALQVCSSLQAAKASTVSGVASATLQQLVSTVFEKVEAEDRQTGKPSKTFEVSSGGLSTHLKPAAFDAYRLLRDLALAAEQRSTKFITFTSLSTESSLELIWSCIDSNIDLFTAHQELVSIIGSNIFPIVLRALSERLPFAVTVRSIRILDLILDGFMLKLPGECEVALGLCAQALDPDFAPEWKRALVMEILRDFFADSSHVIDAYAQFDSRNGGKPVVQDMMSSFVRLSTEKPVAIGLGHQSTLPTGPATNRDFGTEQASLDVTSGMVGAITSALGVTEVSVSGISSQWSLPKITCLEQLDKSEPPVFPETYIYALVLECLNGLSDNLARIVLPLTVHHERNRTKTSNSASEPDTGSTSERLKSHAIEERQRAVPLNPLAAEDAPYAARVKAVADLLDSCWPAVLATSSTFLKAALDDQYFRNLIKAYQRFTQVAGLLRLTTPRDALMTTLAKSSVPPHVLNAATSENAKSPIVESPRVFSNPISLLSVDSLVSQSSTLSTERDRRSSAEPPKPTLMVRNLLCLRALLNLAIALGPTLESAFAIVVGALRHTDLILSTTSPQQMSRQGTSKGTEAPVAVQAFTNEVTAVESAASRLLESTADYPNEAFLNVLHTFYRFLHGGNRDLTSPVGSPTMPSTPVGKNRKLSGLPGLNAFTELHVQDYRFVIPKLGHLAELNIPRFTSEDSIASGWISLVDELMAVSKMRDAHTEARRGATNILVKLTEETIANVSGEEPDVRASVQLRSLEVLLRLVEHADQEDGESSSVDLEVQHRILDSLRSILERSGDTLIAGWSRVIAVIATGAFEHKERITREVEREEVSIQWDQFSYDLASPQSGRAAFAAVQLVCSDFLDSLPSSVMPALIELLYRFMCQTDEFNAALTTITMAWNVSDFLFSTSMERNQLVSFIQQANDYDDLEDDMKPMLSHSKPAQWLFLLIRLRDVAARSQREVRNATFQTVCNVFKNYGEQFPPLAWDVLLRCTILHIARTDSYSYYEPEQGEESNRSLSPPMDLEMSKTIINGNADVVAQHLRVIEQIVRLPSLWEVFLSMLERYLDIENHTINAAVYLALAKVLPEIQPTVAVWKGPTYRTLHLWLKRYPQHDGNDKHSNQQAFLAYAEAGKEIYRLTKDTMSMSQTRTMIDNLYQCIQDSDGPAYGADTANMSPLQAHVMQLLRSVRADQPGIPACLVTVASKLACLHHDNVASEPSSNKPTFVAISCEAIAWLQAVAIPGSDTENLDADALLSAVQSLRRLIESKYAFRLEHKSLPIWRRATSTALVLARPILEQVDRTASDQSITSSLWSEYSSIVSGIVKANHLETVSDSTKIFADEVFDIAAFESLQKVLVPGLGNPALPNETRLLYVRAVFEASIIHAVEEGELPAKDQWPLHKIEKIRRGRTKDVSPTPREEMSYVCWKELINLSRTEDSSIQARKIAQAAAPYLILRLAIPIRAYIADQPLRGRRPQPLSELEELLFCFDAIKSLASGTEALLMDSAGGGRSLEQAHWQHLYPLLIQAVRTAGDKWSGSQEVLMPLQAVLASLSVGA